MSPPTTADRLFAADERLIARRRTQRMAEIVLRSASATAVLILVLLLVKILYDGLPTLLDLRFFTNPHVPSLIARGGSGILDALWASVVILVFTMIVAVPLGIGGAVYLNEYAHDSWFRRSVESWIANLAAVPSVVYGLLGLAVFVRFAQMGNVMLSASFTLALLILPIILVSTIEALKSVPASIREASFGLGATRWQTVRHHVLPSALPGILTGNILALSRAAGETAPVLVVGLPVFVTQLGFSPFDPGTPLQLRIFYLARDSRHAAHELAAGAVVVLVGATLLLNLAAILLRSRLSKKTRW